MHLRLDRITEITVLESRAKHFSSVSQYKEKFDIADYSNKLFNMFSGEEENIILSCSNIILDEIIEKFGEDVPIKTDENDRFRIRAAVEMSEGLVNWILQYGTDIKVIQPKSLANAVKEKSSQILAMYE
jgi:predicted DNA-binding transcriptional regulator YafY